MSDTLTTFMKLIQSPPGQLVAGGALAGIVWKFFERVEAVLNENTKLEIAVWLVDVKTAERVPWPDTFAKVFDRVFGTKHLSWQCFWRSCGASVLMSVVTSAAFICLSEQRVNAGFGVAGFRGWLAICAAMICGLFITDFLSLLETRYLLGQMGRSKSALMVMVMIQADIFITGSLAVCGLAFADFFLRLEVLGRSLPQPVRSSLPGVTFGSMTY